MVGVEAAVAFVGMLAASLFLCGVHERKGRFASSYNWRRGDRAFVMLTAVRSVAVFAVAVDFGSGGDLHVDTGVDFGFPFVSLPSTPLDVRRGTSYFRNLPPSGTAY